MKRRCLFFIFFTWSTIIYADPLTLFLFTGTSMTSSNHPSMTGRLGTRYITHWADSTITWKYNPDDCSLTSAVIENALTQSFEKWDDETTKADLNFVKGSPVTTSNKLNSSDGNVVFFQNDSDIIRREYGIIGIPGTTFLTTNGSTITDVDICLNTHNYTFTQNANEVSWPDSIVLLQRIATHEIGHLLGLSHYGVSATDIMNVSDAWVTDYPIRDDDKFGVAFLRGGRIISNVTLTHPDNEATNDPFIDWDITIDPNVTLTFTLNYLTSKLYIYNGKKITIKGTFLYNSTNIVSSYNTWSGFDIQSGGTLSLAGDYAIIENATTGVKVQDTTPFSIASGDSLIIRNCSSAGIHVYQCSPTIERVHIENVTSGYGGIFVEGSSAYPQLLDITATNCLYGFYLGSYADAYMIRNHHYALSDHCIYLNSYAGAVLENAGGVGANSISPNRATDKKAVFNNATNGTIFADYNYWGTDSPTSAYFGDGASIDNYNNHFDTHGAATGAGASKIGTPEGYRLAMLLEENGDLMGAYDAFRAALISEKDTQTKRLALKSLLRIADRNGKGYNDIAALIADEQKTSTVRDSYRAIVDFLACELHERRGNTAEAIAAFVAAAPEYAGSPMEVEMYCRIADLFGKSGDRGNAREYALRAARINPGQPALMTAFAAAGETYKPYEHADIFADWDGAYKPTEQPDDETVTSAAPTVAVSPNPANPATTISFTLPAAGNVRLDVYAITGQKVATLVDTHLSAGNHAAVFDGANLASGMYFYRLETAGQAKTGKMMLVK